MNDTETPVKPAMNDSEIEAIIAEYLSRKLGPVARRVNDYCALTIDARRYSCADPLRIQYTCYTEATGHHREADADGAINLALASFGDVRAAKRLREEAAKAIAHAEQIEAQAKGSEVAT